MKNSAKILFSVLCFSFSLMGFAQSAVAVSKDSVSATEQQHLKYVKIEVGLNILDCPVLPPNLKAKLMTLKGIRDYAVNRKNETILFALPDGVVTKEGVVAIARSCGFPAEAVNVIMADKPFVN